MEIEWRVGGRIVPAIGKTIVGKTVTVPDKMGQNLIAQGIAKEATAVEEKKDNINDMTRDDLVVTLKGMDINPPDDANKTELRKLLKEAK